MESTPNTGNAAPRAEPPKAASDVQERLGPKLAQAEERLLEVNEQVKSFIRKNPGTCLLGAAALGFLVGRWAARR